jgi:hypothetical protein
LKLDLFLDDLARAFRVAVEHPHHTFATVAICGSGRN